MYYTANGDEVVITRVTRVNEPVASCELYDDDSKDEEVQGGSASNRGGAGELAAATEEEEEEASRVPRARPMLAPRVKVERCFRLCPPTCY